ncbi:MAG: [protein-PII] uridylyltransferase [Methylohalobius sp. ZOD2]
MLSHVRPYKASLQAFHAELERRFHAGAPVVDLLRARAHFIDALLSECWQQHLGDASEQAALAAVGGYGRRELHPHSDIDLLVLVPDTMPPALETGLSGLFTFLWDIGLKPGHSVRTVTQCEEEAAKDQTVVTNLMDARRVAGNSALFGAMEARIGPDRIWPSDAFFQAKLDEQAARYAKYHDTAYNLEPNLKEGPGGIRDIQTIAWVVKRHFSAATLHELVDQGYLTEDEYAELEHDLNMLWRIRFALHLTAERCEDRILFDYQRTLAEWCGYRGEGNAPVETFMQSYFRTAQSVQRLGEMLLQLLEEILCPDFRSEPRTLDEHFQVVNGHLETRHPQVFAEYPLGLLEIFLHLQQHAELKGVRAHTIRAIRQNLHRIDQDFRNDPRACRLFLEILRQPSGITHQFRRMNRYGILAAYLPEFARIVGRMQYDLFHAYTVDEHILFVVRNLRRLALPQYRQELPLATDIFPLIAKPELLYLAGLYHDMGKGQGGDHSIIGERLVRDFCRRHGLPEHDIRLVAWLVRNHLVMSLTAQRKDISDPGVIRDFALKVGGEERLNHLYLLTVADIRGTNPSLWNAWRDSLLRELYLATRDQLRYGLESPDTEERIAEAQRDARDLLLRLGMNESGVERVWRHFSGSYFLRCQPEECAWQTLAIAETPDEDLPLVLLRPKTQHGSAEVFVYMHDRDGIFAQTAALLDQLELTVLAARLEITGDGYVINSFLVLEGDGQPIRDLAREQQISSRIRHCLKDPQPPHFTIDRRPNRRLKHFSIPTQVHFLRDPKHRHTVVELIAADRPGLLARVGEVFEQQQLGLHEARIATLGNRAEDIFFLTDHADQPLISEERREALAQALKEAIR